MGFLMEEKRGLQLSHTVSSLSPTTCPGPLGFSSPIGPEAGAGPRMETQLFAPVCRIPVRGSCPAGRRGLRVQCPAHKMSQGNTDAWLTSEKQN